MRHVAVALSAIVFASSFIGCPLLKKKLLDDDPDTDPEAALVDAATVKVTGTGAKNEDQVLRYETETALPNEPAVISNDGIVARTFPGNGVPVAPLPKGTAVVKIARYHNTAVLVSFDDPSGDGSKLIGWVPPKAFEEAAPAPTDTPAVPTAEEKKSPPEPDPTPRPPQPTNVDAGGGGGNATVVDAGGGGGGNTTVVDAGGGGGGGGGSKGIVRIVPDAGGGGSQNNQNTKPDTDKIPQPPKGVQAVPPVNGKCPDNWALTQGMCRKKCNTDADCDRGIKCAVKSGVKVCTSDG